LYYLQSRYRDPEVGRFINGDEYLDLRETQGMTLYAYCGNDPVNRYDDDGMVWKKIKKKAKSVAKKIYLLQKRL